MGCGVDRGEVGFRPRFVGVDGVWKDFWNDGEASSSLGASERPPPVCWSISSPGVPGSTGCTATQLQANMKNRRLVAPSCGAVSTRGRNPLSSPVCQDFATGTGLYILP